MSMEYRSHMAETLDSISGHLWVLWVSMLSIAMHTVHVLMIMLPFQIRFFHPGLVEIIIVILQILQTLILFVFTLAIHFGMVKDVAL